MDVALVFVDFEQVFDHKVNPFLDTGLFLYPLKPLVF